MRGLPCAARSLRVGQNSLRGLRPLRSDSRPKSEVDARCARPAKPCAAQLVRREATRLAAHRPDGSGVALALALAFSAVRPPPTAQAEVSKPHTCVGRARLRYLSLSGWSRASVRSKAWTGKVAKQRPYCSWAPCEPSRSAGLCRARVSAHQPLTSGGCSSAAAAGRVASSARPAKTEHRRAVGPRPTGEQGALSFAFFSLGKQRKEGRLSGRHPDAPARSRKNEPRDSGKNP
jgi:hypothetical protein